MNTGHSGWSVGSNLCSVTLGLSQALNRIYLTKLLWGQGRRGKNNVLSHCRTQLGITVGYRFLKNELAILFVIGFCCHCISFIEEQVKYRLGCSLMSYLWKTASMGRLSWHNGFTSLCLRALFSFNTASRCLFIPWRIWHFWAIQD